MKHVLLLALFLTGSANAGPFDVFLNGLRAQAQREGWQFQIGDSKVLRTIFLEGIQKVTGHIENVQCTKQATHIQLSPSRAYPINYDLRSAVPYFPPVRDQKNCGSCWAFATTGAMEIANRIFHGPLLDLSEEQLLSCTPNSSCGGGNICQALNVEQSHGQTLDAYQPYTAKVQACNASLPTAARVRSWAFLGPDGGSPQVYEIKEALLRYGGIIVTIHAGGAFSAYKGGVFGVNGKGCTTEKTNHVVVIVGWGRDAQGHDYWIVRNSWGADWGEGGYIRIAPGCNSVGQTAAYLELR
jgi:C1A family cysteine protease